MKKVSLIMTTFNCAAQVEKVLKSIAEQDYKTIEIIVKDGGSTDNTIQVIEGIKRKYNLNLLIKSSPDRGIYDAMNQGFELSTGDIVAFINDVLLESSVVSKMIHAISEYPDCIGAHADLVYFKDGKVKRYWKMGEGSICDGWMPGHPTLFLKREVYLQYGLYKEDYKCSADYEFMVRILKDRKNKLIYVPILMVGMFYGGTSTDGLKGYFLSLKEAHKALLDNGVKFAWLIDLKRTYKVIKQYVNRNVPQINIQEY